MKSFITALQFLTRIKISGKVQTSGDDFSRSLRFFPVVGLLLGVILGLLSIPLSAYGGVFTTAVILIAAEIILTGGLHLDGFMDSCDGLFSGRPREQMLEIMKDSRVGAMGVIGLFVLISFKIALLAELSDRQLFYALIMMPFFSRWLVIYAINQFPYARREGLGKCFVSEDSPKSFIMTSVLCLFIAVLLMVSLATTRLFWALPFAALPVLGLSKRINTVLGGHTGDTYGAIIESAEVIYLFFLFVMTKI